MIAFPNIDPVAFSIGPLSLFGKTIGPLSVHWYGIMYILAFASAFLIGLWRAKKPFTALNTSQVEDLVFYGALGVVLGGRVGYMVFYNFQDLLANPFALFKVWEGGMSFHGGLIGVTLAMLLFARKTKLNFFDVTDFVAPLIPVGLGFGRIGNFIGGELWGRETNVPWGMIFPDDQLGLVRHPSQLYQAFLEGFLLAVLILWFANKPRPRATVSAFFLIFYGIQRFFVEFFREPDAHIGLVFQDWLSRGQLLSIPMIVVGVAIFYGAYVKNYWDKR